MPWSKSLAASTLLAGVLALPAAWADGARAGEAIEVETRLSQRLLTENRTQKVYVRIGVKGAAAPRESARVPANVVLVIDRSGSMKGDRIVKAREAAIMAVDRLSERDITGVVVFDDKIDVLAPAQRIDRHEPLRDKIRSVTARGSTAIYAAMQEAAREVRRNKSANRLNRIILMSDGLANVGPSKPDEFARLGRELGGEGISVTTIGLGSDYNEDLMSRLASSSDGSHAFARSSEDLTRIFNSEFDDVLSVAAQDLTIRIECRNGARPLRSLGRDSTLDGSVATMQVPNVYGSSQYSLQFELEVPQSIARGEVDIADITLTYRPPGGSAMRTVTSQVRARFSTSEEEVRASVDASVMEPIVELEARERTERAIKLRDEGKIEDAKIEFQRNAEELVAAKSRFKFNGSARIDELERNSREAAARVEAEGDWKAARKQMRQDQTNAPAALTGKSAYGASTRY